MTPRPVDIREVRPALEQRLPGYGLTPRSARERAKVVKAVTDSRAIRQRPMPVVLTAAAAALAALAIWAWRLYGVLTADEPPDAVFWLSLVVSVGALFVCAWAWELYDVRRAIVVAVALLATAFVAVFVIVIAVAALRGKDVDLDLPDLRGMLDGDAGSRDRAPLRADVIDDARPAVMGAIRSVADLESLVEQGRDDEIAADQGEAPEAYRADDLPPELDPDDPRATVCGECGFRFDTQERLACPRCGRPA